MFILPKIPSFGERFAESLTQGVGKGVDLATELMGKRFEQNQKMKLAQAIESGDYGDNSSSLSPVEAEQSQDSISSNLSGKKDPFSKAKAYAAAGLDTSARIASEEAKVSEKRKMAEEEREFLPKKEYLQHAAKRNTQYLDSIGQVEKDLPNTEFSLAMIEDSLGDANKWAAAKDWLADHTGYAGFKSAAGAELDSAIKNYFLGDLTSIKGGRANVFLEKQIRDAYMRAGQDPISNQKILLGMKLKENINRARVEKTRELERKYIDKLGYLPPDFESLVSKSLKEDIHKFEKDAIDTLHHMTKIEDHRDKLFRGHLKHGETLMMSPDGEPYAVKKSEVAAYRNQGYIPMGRK